MTQSGDDDRGSPASFEEGRYLYCVVGLDEETEPVLTQAGIDDGDPYVIDHGDIGVVVQDCQSPYDSTDVETVRRWLLQHQAVIDAAGERFGTPLPFRFDTIIKGDDAEVRDWLADTATTLADALSEFAGTWEYRIELVRDPEAIADRLAEDDEQLAELRERQEEATSGTAFLLNKQYQQRVQGLTQQRVEEETETLAERLRQVAVAVEPVDRSTSTLEDERSAQDEEVRRTLALLARPEQEDDLGSLLDDFADRPGAEVRFTGPWPPYSFAPTLGDEP